MASSRRPGRGAAARPGQQFGLVTKPNTRHAKPVASYREDSSDIEAPLDDSDAYSSAAIKDTPLAARASQRRKGRLAPSKNGTRGRVTAVSTRPQRTKESQRTDGSKKRRRSVIESHQVRKKKVPATIAVPRLSAGRIPPWHTLPYQILVEIFQYASSPLYDPQTFVPSGGPRWLLGVSRLCRAFGEPAITALYKSPPLVPMESAHMLEALLRTDPTGLSYNYRAKLERLQIEVYKTAVYKLTGRGYLDLQSLVRHSPRLMDVELYHDKDFAPYRHLDDNIKWTYPESLFAALEETGTRLRSWRWNARMAGASREVKHLEALHSQNTFNKLQKLAFVNYQAPPDPKGKEEDPHHEQLVGQALKGLPELRHLIFESCTLLNSKLLPLLPSNLQRLELTNCWDVDTDDLSAFLQSHGSQLQELTLNHNYSLNLSFLQVLGHACPKLEVLRMNLTLYGLHPTYRNSDPNFGEMLSVEEVPHWPAKLQILELVQLRNWDTETAEMFFQSLLDSARDLPDLRQLVIKAILKIGWRDRATFRDKWIGALERCFTRKSAPPNPDYYSFATIEASKRRSNPAAIKKHESSNGDSVAWGVRVVETTGEVSEPRQARSTRSRPSLDSGKTWIVPETSGVLTKKRSSLSNEIAELVRTSGRNGPRSRPSPVKPVSGSQSELDSDDQPLVRETSRSNKRAVSVHGMCDVVDIRIDNLRPTENQFTEANFLDSEPEGDEDWNEDSILPGEEHAW